MFDESILTINELAKIKASAGTGGGGAGSQFSANEVPFVAKASFIATSLDYANYAVQNQSSESYTHSFNHGGGQFSFANGPTYTSSPSRSEFYVKPFTVNQTTGAITEGSGSAVWTNTSYNGGFSTGTWGQSSLRSHCFHHGHNYFPGYSSNTYGSTGWVVSGNSVSGGTYTINNSYGAVSNEESYAGSNGSTSYWVPNTYNGNAYKHAYSFTSGSLSNISNSNLSSNTSTNYTTPIVPQFNNTVVSGGLHFYQNSNGMGKINVFDVSGNTQNTYNTYDFGITYDANTQGMGIQLSNGRQLFYTNTGSIILNNGGGLSDVTNTADFIPGYTTASSFTKTSQIFTPVGVNTWFVYDRSVNELVKFSINPTTYKVTIIGSKLITSLTKNARKSYDSGYFGGAWVTGSNNQFIVVLMSRPNTTPIFDVIVGQNSLVGA